jgi:hypothetical protein
MRRAIEHWRVWLTWWIPKWWMMMNERSKVGALQEHDLVWDLGYVGRRFPPKSTEGEISKLLRLDLGESSAPPYWISYEAFDWKLSIYTLDFMWMQALRCFGFTLNSNFEKRWWVRHGTANRPRISYSHRRQLWTRVMLLYETYATYATQFLACGGGCSWSPHGREKRRSQIRYSSARFCAWKEIGFYVSPQLGILYIHLDLPSHLSTAFLVVTYACEGCRAFPKFLFQP